MGVLLISENKLKAFTNLNKNIDMDFLKAEIQICQDIDLQTLLGTPFYNHLLSCVTITGDTFNNNEKTLVDSYIQPYLLQQSYFQCIPHLWARSMNRGIVVGDMESAHSVDIETMKYLRTVQKQRADFYMTRLQDYLLIGYGQNQFPQYNQTSSIEGMIPDRSQKYNNSIYLKHTTRKGYNDRRPVGNLPSYSDIEMSNPPCMDCY
jgi:hypothetical protein